MLPSYWLSGCCGSARERLKLALTSASYVDVWIRKWPPWWIKGAVGWGQGGRGAGKMEADGPPRKDAT